MNTLWNNLRYAIRMFAKNPAFTAIAVFTLALGIGANTAIFSVVDGVLLHPLPFAHSDRIVWAWGQSSFGGQAPFSPPNFVDYRARNHSFQYFGGFFVEAPQPENLAINGHTEQLRGSMVTADFFETLGAKPLLGRTFSIADEQTKLPNAIILSYSLWKQKFGGDAGVIGRTAIFEGDSTTIIGVMPPKFGYPPNTDIWFPTPMLNPGMQLRTSGMLSPIGLLKPGMTMAKAQADLDAISHSLNQQYPDAVKNWTVHLVPMQEAIVGPVREPLLLLLGAVGLVLLIACANVANLVLARNNTRQREIGIRTALGASRMRIIGQLLTENLVLSCAGGVLGVLLASWGVAALRALGPASLPRLDEVQLSGSILVFTAALSILTGVLCGLIPSFHSAKLNVHDSLKEGSHSSAGGARQRLRSALVVSEVTLSVALLIGAGLILNSLWRMLHVNPGFDSRGVLTTQMSLSDRKSMPQQVAFYRGLLGKLQVLPGLTAAGGVSELPLSDQYDDDYFTPAPIPPASPRDADDADYRVIAGDYLQAMRIPLLQGRLFSQQDQPTTSRKVIIDETLAHKYYARKDPVGGHLWVWEGSAGFVNCEIVGVVGGIRHFALQIPPRPTMYFPFTQVPRGSLDIVARTAMDPTQLASGIRAAVAAIDPDETLSPFQTMQQIVSESAAGDRFNTLLFGLFGALALILAAAGIYGVMSYAVTQRTHEIGIRLALGAQPATVLRMVIGQGMTLVAIGTILGLGAAVGLTRLMASQLFGVTATDPMTFAAAAIVLGIVAALACYIPARRAMKVDPMVALRYE
ncbi:MAG: ABC transporter permease [Candidatus Acidiferrales bacterium]